MTLEKKIVGDFIDAAVQDASKASGMLRQYPELRDARWIHNETALHFLAVEGSADAVRVLGQLGLDPNARNEFGDTALVDVAQLGNDEVARALLEIGANPDAISVTRDNVLHAGISSGNARLVDLLLSAGANPYYRTELGETIFNAPLRDETTGAAIRKALEQHGLDPSQRPSQEYWYDEKNLHMWAQNGNLEKVRQLVEEGCDVNAFDELGNTPLHYAAEHEHFDAVSFLIDHGANVNARHELYNGNAALGSISGQCSLRMARLLLDAGADPTIPGWKQLNALDRAERRKDGEGPGVYRLLLEEAARRGHLYERSPHPGGVYARLSEEATRRAPGRSPAPGRSEKHDDALTLTIQVILQGCRLGIDEVYERLQKILSTVDSLDPGQRSRLAKVLQKEIDIPDSDEAQVFEATRKWLEDQRRSDGDVGSTLTTIFPPK
jgi:ankyrin repeat protein